MYISLFSYETSKHFSYIFFKFWQTYFEHSMNCLLLAIVNNWSTYVFQVKKWGEFFEVDAFTNTVIKFRLRHT